MNHAKEAVREFWNQAACGEDLYLTDTEKASYATQARTRYALEPYILDFARFPETRGLRVLEIGVGLGADHQQFAEAGADLWGIDLTERAIEHTRRRLAAFGLNSHLAVGDAEHLEFSDESFDRVYSWGVLHHSPDTPQAIAEVWRVLKRGGGEPHDLPQAQRDRLDAVAALRPAGRATLAFLGRYLCPSSRKPWHQSVHGRPSPATMRPVCRDPDHHSSHSR